MLASEYMASSEKTDRIDWNDPKGWTIVPYGLIGEIGSLAEVLKKYRRDKKNEETLRSHIREEVGDIIWYLFSAARRAGISDLVWPEVHLENIDVYSSLNRILAGALRVVGERQTLEMKVPSASMREAVDIVLTGLEEIARTVSMTLPSIADHAIDKNKKYWSDCSVSAPSFDRPPHGDFPEYECLPREFSIHFLEVPNKKELIISMNGVQIGDRLTDNTHTDSGYRYHDVFHMSAAAFLGWSPVFRRMLKKKRKSSPRVDENEDGARAAIIEEAVVSQVYRYGAQSNFKPIEHIDEDLIKLIMAMTTEYECKHLEGRDWKLYATKSIEIFGKVKDGFTGTIKFYSENRSFEIIPDI